MKFQTESSLIFHLLANFTSTTFFFFASFFQKKKKKKKSDVSLLLPKGTGTCIWLFIHWHFDAYYYLNLCFLKFAQLSLIFNLYIDKKNINLQYVDQNVLKININDTSDVYHVTLMFLLLTLGIVSPVPNTLISILVVTLNMYLLDRYRLETRSKLFVKNKRNVTYIESEH